MSASIYVYSKSTPFSIALVKALQSFGGAILLSETSLNVPTHAAMILVCDSFHKISDPHLTQKVIEIISFTDKPTPPLSRATYYYSLSGDLSSVVDGICNAIKGFDMRKPHVFAPNPLTLPTGVVFVPVSAQSMSQPLPSVVVKAPTVKHTSVQDVKKSSARTRRKIRMPRIRISPRPFILLLVIAVWLLFFPLLTLSVSAGCSYFGVKALTRLETNSGKQYLYCSQNAALITIQAGGTIASLPLMSNIMRTPLGFAHFLNEASTVAIHGADLALTLKSDPSIKTLKNMSPLISQFSRELSLLTSRAEELSVAKVVAPQISSLITKVPLVNLLNALSARAGVALGEGKMITYMVLLQNNMELRPTGGFIGSFALVDVQEARVVSYKIYDVYDADGQLAGFVRPPEPIRQYLGEAKWTMRDSNWDPDFATSARRAAWFLEKTLDVKVSGVIGVNLEVLRGIIKQTGPIEIADYGGTLTSENFYSKIQGEVHKEFFPGSRKKSNYLTAVVNGVLAKLESDRGANALPLLLGFSDNTTARDIQLYATDPILQDALQRAGVSGSMSDQSIGFIEANLGVNKANQYIERKGSVRIEKRGAETLVKTILTITNKAAQVGDETRYRVYLRSLAPAGGVLDAVSVKVSGQPVATVPEMEQSPERITAGVFFEVKAGESGEVESTWKLPRATSLVFWKQGGVGAYPISVTSLTEGGERTYNTELSKDIEIQL